MGEELVAYLENFGDKTFIIKEGDTIRVVNGSLKENDSDYTITSFAPYIEHFYYIDDNDIKELDSTKGQRSIVIKKTL